MRSWIENELIELINSDQFRLSIPIQFQFNSNSIHAELNWIDYQFQFNSWIDPSPDNYFTWPQPCIVWSDKTPQLWVSIINYGYP